MPLLFLLIYIWISYFIYKKNKDNIEKIPVILQLTGIIGFVLLFVFIIYYSEVSLSYSEKTLYLYSFYFLSIGYLVTYIVYFIKYKNLLKENKYKQKISNDIWNLESVINKSYYIVLLILALTYFIFSNPFNVYRDDWLQILLYMFFIWASLFILFKNKLLS